MEKSKITIEIYEGDPFGSTCCGPGTRVTSLAAVDKLRNMLEERSEIVKRLSEEYKDKVTIKRDTINQKRWNYPEYVLKLMMDSKPVPYIFINGESVLVGKFPSYEEFVTLVKARLGNEQIDRSLKQLQNEGLLRRESFAEIPPRVEYSLTEDGRGLRAAVVPILKWAATRQGSNRRRCSVAYREMPAHRIRNGSQSS